ncbi:hypothetical protein [Leptolyngbya sp. NIES-2104]|uniref:hypothetical protein n=1 Tax=Leptolyngbya sp. NIES-2104 TaxID=1552121 RepID=UPI0006EC527E|nr:hypothetical protein [Leptolyngbya sp. NIES-2104]GAP98160.1 hypothetical protein NIES2104_47130 [Leptolyngbya sp. NIES-2104]
MSLVLKLIYRESSQNRDRALTTQAKVKRHFCNKLKPIAIRQPRYPKEEYVRCGNDIYETQDCHFAIIDLNQSVLELAEQFLERSNLPAKADVDAVHIAAATVHGMDYLLTWNCKHIANAQIQGKLAEISLDFGYELPILCTAYELLGG